MSATFGFLTKSCVLVILLLCQPFSTLTSTRMALCQPDNKVNPKKCLKGYYHRIKDTPSEFSFTFIFFLASIIGTILFISSLASQAKSVFALLNSQLLAASLIIRWWYREKMGQRMALVFNFVVFAGFAMTIPSFFLAVGPVVQKNNILLVDSALVKIDSGLLGWVFPSGQISLKLDQSVTSNPSTTWGRIYTEVFQLFYFSYYLWGYLVLVVLIYQYVRAWRNTDKYSVAEPLSKLKLYISGWMCAYYMTFLFNLIFPAQSPRIYLKEEYTHALEGFGLAKFLIGISTDDSSFGSFPSGHVCQSIVAGVYALRINFWFGLVVIGAGVCIAIATQLLRYHYFVDLIAAMCLVGISCLYGFFLTQGVHDRQVMKLRALYGDTPNKISLKDENDDAIPLEGDDEIVDLNIDVTVLRSQRSFIL